MFLVYTSDRYVVPLPPEHRFPIQKYRLLRGRLIEERVLKPQQLREPDPVAPEILSIAHDADYVRRVLIGDLNPSEIRRLGFPWSPELTMRARYSVGGTLSAARSALKDGMSGNLAGGTHHAHPDFGSGYCTFNDVAVSVRVLQKEGVIARALVIDLDVHQGDGTASFFERDESVFTFSMHGANNFPFRKAKSDLDIELADECEDEVYLSKLNEYLNGVIESLKPDIVFYLAGVDPLKNDRLGKLALSLEGLKRRDQRVIESCLACQIPLVIVMAGGYAEPIEDTVRAHVGTYQALNQSLVY
jgi:acetoin utilization deacetylase AcuC-like enzyme